MFVRERPPLRLSLDVKSPSGQHYRWAEDERSPSVVPSSLSFSSTVPGGFESLSCALPRKPDVEYGDLERLSTITVYDAAASIVGQYRLEGAPRTSGDQMAVSPAAVGWQAALEDDKSAKGIYRDADMSHWTTISNTYRRVLIAFTLSPVDGSVDNDVTAGTPVINLAIEGNASTTAQRCFLTYDAGVGNAIGTIDYIFARGTNVTSSWDARVETDSTDQWPSVTQTSNLASGASALGTLTAGSGDRFGRVTLYTPAGDGGTDGLVHGVIFGVAVWGNHGLTHRTNGTEVGLFASDIISHAVSNFAPALAITTDSIVASSAIIPHLVFYEPTTVAEIISAANRFELYDWATWEGQNGQPTFFYYPRGARGKSWRSRVAPAELAEVGPDVQRLWNGVIVRYQDVDGTTRTVGPTGSGADTESVYVTDSDPDNPANQRGIRRWDILDMGIVSTAAAATVVGRLFLEQANQLDTSGQAQLVGYVEDDRGVIWPASHVRAGDTISFIDAADTSARRIVKASYDHSSRTTSVDLDAPPDGLAALLERLQATLVPLGL